MTTRIQVSDAGLEVIPPRDTLTQGSENTLTIEFQFSGQWLECTEINAVFTDDINSATVPVTGGACVVPVEVLQNPWRFVTLSLNGTSASGVITSPFVRIGQVLPSAMGGEGGKFVTMAQLMEILQGYVKTEDLGVYVTQEQLQDAIATLATQDDIARLDELKADKTTVAALAGTVAAQGVEIGNKADAATVTALETRVGTNETNVAALQNGKADKTQLADYWSKAEIGLQTDGDGKQFLANDGKYYEVQGGGGDAKTFIAEYNVTTAQEIIAFIDAANEPYAPMQVKRGTDYYTVTTAAKQDANKVIIRTFATLSGNFYMFTYTITGSTWATASYGFQKLLESGTNIKTINGQSLLGSGDIPIEGGTQVQADWNQTDDTSPAYIKNKPTIPDVSGLATQASVDAVSDTVSALETRVGTAETNITALQNDKADKSQLADYETSEHAAATFATKTELTEGLAGKVDTADIADMLTKTEAESTYADKVSLLTLENTVDAQAARIGQAETNITALQTNIAGKASDADLQALSARVGTNETNITALQNDKADASALADYETTAHAAATYASKDYVDKRTTTVTATGSSGSWGSEYTKVIEQANGGNITFYRRVDRDAAGTRTVFTVDGTQLVTADTAPDFSSLATKTELSDGLAIKADAATVTALSATVAANTAAIATNAGDIATLQTDKADASALADYETTAHAAATYETKADASQVKSITAAGFEVTPDSAGNVNIGGTDVSRATTSGSWGAETTYTISQTLPAGATSDTKGSSLTIFKRTENSGANPHIIMRIDGVQIATSADIPDVSRFATTDYVQNTFESTQHASETYLKIADAASTYATQTAISDMATQTWVQQYIASLDGTNMKF